MSEGDQTQSATRPEYITLTVGGQHFCIDIIMIREIRRWSPVTLLPYSADYVLGVINLRGAVIPIIDLSAKLGYERINPTERHVIIVAKIENRILGLLVDGVSEILSTLPDMIKDTPKGLEDGGAAAISGIIPNEDSMIKIIDLSALFADHDPVAA